MKNILIFRICCLTIICFVGFSPTAYLRAQQAVAVSPEVKADTLQRLELARTWIIPSSDEWIKPTDWPKGNIKEARNLCNRGPHGSDVETQQAGCLNFLMWTKYGHITSASLDELMPVFKLCAFGGQDFCRRTMEYLLQTGHPDYSLAIAEYAPTCNGCFTLWNFSVGPDGYQIDLSPGTTASIMGEDHVHVTNPSDVINLLRIACLGNGSQLACQWYQQTGVAVSESQREQAAANQQATEDRAAAAKDEQFNRGQQHSQESAQAWNNVVGALNSANATIQHPMPYPAPAPAQAQPAPNTSAPAARSSSVSTSTTAPATTPTAGTAPSGGNSPYNSVPAQGNYNPYTGTGSGSVQGSCTDMTASVQGTVKIGSDGWVSGYLTNNSNQTLYVSYTFKQNGAPSTAMANAGGTTIQGGQTVGGEGQGLYSTGADKNPPEIYWYAVLKLEHDKYGCVHKW